MKANINTKDITPFQIQKYCYAGTKSTYSKDMVQFSLPRAGCDGEPNSGKEMMQCGCGDDRSCLDCLGEPNGSKLNSIARKNMHKNRIHIFCEMPQSKFI
jgi:hypothetical protein